MNINNFFNRLWLTLSLGLIITACGSSSSSEDITPDTFSFDNQTNIALSTLITSEQVIIKGIDDKTPVTVTGGEYSINNGSFTSASSIISNSQSLKLRLMSSAEYDTSTSMTVTVGSMTETFSVSTIEEPESETTVAPIITPEPAIKVVDINYNLRHVVGGIDAFDRQKFITIHAELTEHDWFDNDQFSRNAANENENLIVNFLEGFDVYLGRSTGGITWHLNQIQQDPARPGFVSEADATSRGNGAKWSYNNLPEKKQAVYQLEQRALDTIVGAQQHPFYPEGTLTKGGQWALSQVDSQSEPLGTATGHYMSQYFAKFFDQNAEDNVRSGQQKPKYVEVMNEPLYDLTTVRDGADRVDPADIFRFHNTVANEIRKENDDLLVGGYTAAFPDFDTDNFTRWQERDKQFIDIAGENMDFYSIHLYDFPTFRNTEKYRRGSNVEATMDMLESYSLQTFGETRPLVISEYGAQVHDHQNKGWTPVRNTHSIRATNSMLMQFMERPDMILKTIPFIVVKAEWGRTETPYGPRLMIQKFERDGADAGDEWVYSDLVLFYQLWSEVNGTRVDTKANDLDIQTDAYIQDNTAFIILNSLEFDAHDISLNHFGLNGNTVSSVTINHLKTQGTESRSVIDTIQLNELPDSVTLDAEATMVIKVQFTNDVTIDQTLTEQKYYSDLSLTAISQQTDGALDNIKINDINVGETGEAILRLGVSREHNSSLTPTVFFNGTQIAVPADFRGYDQRQGVARPGRDNFYGVIEVAVPWELLQTNNTVSIAFDDAASNSNGFVASAALQVFDSTIALQRSNSDNP